MRKSLKSLTTRILGAVPVLAALACMKEDTTAPTTEPDLAASATAVQPKIAFARLLDFREIFVMNGDGTGQRRLTFGRSNEFPVWSPTASRFFTPSVSKATRG